MPLPLLQTKTANKASDIGYIIGVAAGKGGVGKSTVSVNLSLALKALGFSVGIMDTDIYGPSIRKMLSEDELPKQEGDFIEPAICMGLKMISMAYFRKEDEAAVVRAPVANGIIQQFIKNVNWGKLDFLIVDFPPGTGDIQLTLAQHAKLAGTIMVTTPQEVALLDVRKAMKMFDQVKVPVIGIVENMSYYSLPDETIVYPFGKGGGKRLAEETGFPLISEIPLEPKLSSCCDLGLSIFANEDTSTIANVYLNLAKTMLGRLQVMKNRAVDVERIMQKDKHTFTVTWSDGIVADFRLSELQKRCPCAGCLDEITGKSKVDITTIPEDLKASQIDPVGRYALRIQFTSGCNKGIYSFSYLRQLFEEIKS